MRLEGKVALVLGSTRGIGRTFACEGAKVAVTGRTVDRGEKVVRGIIDAGGDAEFSPSDINEEVNPLQSLTGALTPARCATWLGAHPSRSCRWR